MKIAGQDLLWLVLCSRTVVLLIAATPLSAQDSMQFNVPPAKPRTLRPDCG